MAKVLFSHSYYYQLDAKQWKMGTPYPPLGTIYAAAYMRENGYDVSLFDVCLKSGPEEIERVLQEHRPDYLVLYDDGFNYLTKMCLTNMREAAFKMIKIAKKYDCKIVVSSSDSTDHFEKYLDKGADVIIIGEGEVSLLEILNSWEANNPLAGVKGISYPENSKIITTEKRSVLKELDTLPQPAWDLIDVGSYRNIWRENGHEFTLNIATTRGCPYHCNWCAKPIYGQRYNTRSVIKSVAEIKFLQSKYGVSKFWMCDDIFGLKPGWVQSFRDELHSQDIVINYKIQSRADLLLKEDTIDALAASGLHEVWIGAESGSQKVLDAMDKGTTIDQIRESTELLKSKGIRVAFFLQFGYLDETKEDVAATIKMLLDYMPDDIGVSVSYPLPGTKFYDLVKSQLTEKANWTDSDDLALMFKNTFNQDYYKILHQYVHKVFRDAQSKNIIATNPLGSLKVAKAVAKRVYYTPIIYRLKNKLNKLSNVS